MVLLDAEFWVDGWDLGFFEAKGKLLDQRRLRQSALRVMREGKG